MHGSGFKELISFIHSRFTYLNYIPFLYKARVGIENVLEMERSSLLLCLSCIFCALCSSGRVGCVDGVYVPIDFVPFFGYILCRSCEYSSGAVRRPGGDETLLHRFDELDMCLMFCLSVVSGLAHRSHAIFGSALSSSPLIFAIVPSASPSRGRSSPAISASRFNFSYRSPVSLSNC